MVDSNNNEVLAAWETSSQYWNKHRTLIETMFAPLTRALIESAHIVPGQSVLDIGGGSGEPSLTIAPLVGESGSVTYTDPVAGMVKTAREEAGRRGLKSIQFRQCPAQALPFSDNSFDVAVGRLSVMFFPDVPAGLRDILRVSRPDAYLSFVVWAPSEVNPFFRLVTEVLNEFLPADPEDEDAPGAFRFARPGKFAESLTEAGAASVVERTLLFSIEAPITMDRFWELRSEMSDTLREKLAKLSSDQVSAVRASVEKVAAPYFKNGEMGFPAQALVVTGKKPH